MSILTMQEATDMLKLDADVNYPELNIILPAIDDYLKTGTGKDWGSLTDTYTVIDPTAKMVASVLLVRWHEDPGMIGKVNDPTLIGLVAQLHAKALVEVTT